MQMKIKEGKTGTNTVVTMTAQGERGPLNRK